MRSEIALLTMAKARKAVRLVEVGNDHLNAGRLAEAEEAYLAATESDAEWAAPLYNLGLIYKYQCRWTESLAYNQRAVALDSDNEAAWWNLGIAATALGMWEEARRSWRACGLRLPDGEGEPKGDFGPVPLRLDPDDQGEVVWGRRIDPARARIVNVPLPTSHFRWSDIVLHDGAPEGYRILGGTKLPVFNVLVRVRPSQYKTFIVELGTADPEAIHRLEQIASECGGAAENWGSSTNILCRACSFGVPHQHDEDPGSPAHPHCGIAALNETHVHRILDTWLATTPRADLVRWRSIDSTV